MSYYFAPRGARHSGAVGDRWVTSFPRLEFPLVASGPMTAAQPLPFDPIARAADLWEEHIGPSSVMGAVTSVMRVQQILQSAVDTALRPHGLTFARWIGWRATAS
jgi:hypothetical protein